jgi:hypothetical protein
VYLLVFLAACTRPNPSAPENEGVLAGVGETTNGESCDVVAQSCKDPQNPRCSILNVGTTTAPSLEPRCVSQNGSAPEGAVCNSSALGYDNCARGLWCSSVGHAAGDSRCSPLCHRDADCSSGEFCAAFGDSAPGDGLCLKRCTPFGNDCPSGLSCADVFSDIDGTNNHAACRSVGNAAACTTNSDCPANDVCVLSPLGTGDQCVPLCDNAHACGTAGFGICQPLPGLSNGAGYCS